MSSLTIVDYLDTLWIMELHDDFTEGRNWVAQNLTFDVVCAIETIFVRVQKTEFFSLG